MWNLKKGINEPTCTTEIELQMQKTNYGYQMVRGGRDKLGGCDWHILYTKQITNEDLLYSTGNPTQHSVITYMWKGGFPGGSVVKNPLSNARDIRDVSSIPGSGRSPGGGKGNPLQYSYRENPMGGGTWWAAVHGVTKSWTWLSTHARCVLHMQREPEKEWR